MEWEDDGDRRRKQMLGRIAGAWCTVSSGASTWHERRRKGERDALRGTL